MTVYKRNNNKTSRCRLFTFFGGIQFAVFSLSFFLLPICVFIIFPQKTFLSSRGLCFFLLDLIMGFKQPRHGVYGRLL